MSERHKVINYFCAEKHSKPDQGGMTRKWWVQMCFSRPRAPVCGRSNLQGPGPWDLGYIGIVIYI